MRIRFNANDGTQTGLEYFLQRTLRGLNATSNCHVVYTDFKPQYTTRDGTQVATFKLRIHDSVSTPAATRNRKFAAKSFSGRQSSALCWHGHYEFFSEMFSFAKAYGYTVAVTTDSPRGRRAPMTYTSYEDFVTRARSFDQVIGSPAYGYTYLSELCDCDNPRVHPTVLQTASAF